MPEPSSRSDTLDRLSRFEPFHAVPLPALRLLARSVRWLQVPAGRYLVRPGRVLSDTLYLCEGRIRVLDGGHTGVVEGGSRRARRPVYPGAQLLTTLTASRFAAVPTAAVERMRGHPAGPSRAADPAHPDPELGSGLLPALPRVTTTPSSWQARFLSSPLLQHLRPADWQRLLRSLTPREFAAGEPVLRRGEPARCCYVLQRGRVEVWTVMGAAAARLDAGALFGEDALVTGGTRNASVIASGAVVAGELQAEGFRRWLLSALPDPLRHAGGRRLISLEPGCPGAMVVPLAEIRAVAPRLRLDAGYAVTGGNAPCRSLAALLLTQRGLDARALQ